LPSASNPRMHLKATDGVVRALRLEQYIFPACLYNLLFFDGYKFREWRSGGRNRCVTAFRGRAVKRSSAGVS
jgi:hypothetical protein